MAFIWRYVAVVVDTTTMATIKVFQLNLVADTMKQAQRRVSIFVSFIVIKMSNFCLDFDNTELLLLQLLLHQAH